MHYSKQNELKRRLLFTTEGTETRFSAIEANLQKVSLRRKTLKRS